MLPVIEHLKSRGSLSRLSLFALLLLPLGCGLFESRDAEDPSGDTTAEWLPPITPGAVIHNIQEAIRVLDRTNYLSALAQQDWQQPFSFIADPQLVEGSALENWGLAEETGYWYNLVEQLETAESGAAHELLLAAVDSTLYGDSAAFHADYLLLVGHQRSGLPTQFEGSLRLMLTRDNEVGDWAVSRWEDFAADSSGGWSRLRSEFSW